MKASKIHTHQPQLSAMIPFRYRTLLYLNIFLLAIDLCINAFSEYLAANAYQQLIIFIVQDVCIVLSITLLIIMVLTTYVAQAGLLCLLLRMFRFPLVAACIYLALCAATQILILLPRFPDEKFEKSTFARTEVLVLYIIQRTFSAFYYYAMKRAAYRLSDPHFYQSSKWLQTLWERRRMAVTGLAMQTASTATSGTATNRCLCCAIQLKFPQMSMTYLKLRLILPSNHMFVFVRTYRQPQRSTGPKSQEGEFRTLQLTPAKHNRSGPMKKRVKPQYKEVLPPRYLRMSTDQDWTNVWPTATTFKQSVVPLPITQGYIASDKENKGLPLEKYANAELMKIPNFFHLTPNHIKKHCAAIKQYCTPWPEELNSDEACEYYLPIQITTYDYLNSTPSIRDSRARVVNFKFKLTQLEFDEHARDKFIRLAGQRYNADADELTLIADKCPFRKQNYDYAQYLLTALYFESWKTENWEQDRTKNDWQRYYWDESPSHHRLLDILKASEKDPSSATSKSLLDRNNKLVERYRESISRVQDEGVENELKNLNDYKNDVLSLYNLKL